MARKSEAVKTMVELIKAPMEEEFIFSVPKGQGKKKLHRVRVELSRIREVARQNKLTVTHFKIIDRGIKPDPNDPNKELVVVLKTAGETGKLQGDVLSMLTELGAVKQIEA